VDGDVLNFQYYDASEDEVMPSVAYYTFVINDLVGNLMTPHEINVGTLTLSVAMGEGWNWFSVNVVGDDMHPNTVLSTLEPELNDMIKDQNDFAIYYGEDYGWTGALTEIDVKSMYMISTSNAGILEYSGVPVDPGNTPITIGSGWNWIGYLPQSYIGTNDALGTVVADLNDMIKDQNDFAIYYGEDYGWTGSLGTMSPGKGYMLSVSYDSYLIYPSGDPGMSRMTFQLDEEDMFPVAISSWAVNPHAYEFNATMTLSIDSHEDFEGDYVGVFVGDECRGVAERKKFMIDGSYNYSVMVYSNIIDGEKMNFKYYNSQDDDIVDYVESVEYVANMNIGNGFDTFGLSHIVSPEEFNLTGAYPNPFNPTTRLTLDIPEAGQVSVQIYNLMGQVVATLASGYMDADTYTLIWDASNMSSGVYFVKAESAGMETTQKLMLMK